jgi:hypothetical protein
LFISADECYAGVRNFAVDGDSPKDPAFVAVLLETGCKSGRQWACEAQKDPSVISTPALGEGLLSSPKH